MSTFEAHYAPETWKQDTLLTKIVIGWPKKPKSDKGAEAEEVEAETGTRQQPRSLPDNFAELYPNLTHLYLWGQTELTVLPKLPDTLLSLDIRYCDKIKQLPSLPSGLCLLDLGGCTTLRRIGALPATLESLYINECVSLKDVDIEHCKDLFEFDGSECKAIENLDELPRSIAKLVLSSCPKLISVEGLDEFTNLRHLNLRGCNKLNSLPEIPDGIQYLELRNNERLKYYKNQTIGPYDRGSKDTPNVAERLYVRKVFGDNLSAAAQSKLLFLGDGRVGKTTLSKALRWYTLSSEQRASGTFDGLKPNSHEPYTRDITFSRWQTAMNIDASAAAELNARASTANLPPVCDSSNRCDGTIRMWDFAGQELYHQTHRIFAAEGSVFILVWSVDTRQAIDETEHDVTEEEWDEWNRQRSLDYWLDYIDSIRPDASITLVCTGCSKGEIVDWRRRAPKHKERVLKAVYIDSLDPGVVDPTLDTEGTRAFGELVQHLQVECGYEAERLGILQPTFYSTVRAHLDTIVERNTQVRASEQVLLRKLDEWHTDLTALDSSLKLKPQHMDAVTGYLNDSGVLIRIKSTDNPAVLIDQSWGASIIYKLLQRPPGGSRNSDCLYNIIQVKRGLFNESDLGCVEEWQKIESASEKQLLLSYMAQSGIVVRILSADEYRSRNDSLYLRGPRRT